MGGEKSPENERIVRRLETAIGYEFNRETLVEYLRDANRNDRLLKDLLDSGAAIFALLGVISFSAGLFFADSTAIVNTMSFLNLLVK